MVALAALAIGTANAATTTFYGFDSGAGAGPRPNSNAAQASFLSALTPGTVGVETFEGHSAGAFPGGSISLTFLPTLVTGTMTDLPSAVSAAAEVRVSPAGPDYFATSGTKLAVVAADGNPPEATSGFVAVSFTTPQRAIGFYGSSFSDYSGIAGGPFARIQISLDGGPGIDTVLPDPSTIVPGSINFFGLITDTPFSTARLFNPDHTVNDGIGIDDLTIGSPAAIPEPSTWLLMLVGLAGVVVLNARRQRSATRYAGLG
jgi:hypothetical protein